MVTSFHVTRVMLLLTSTGPLFARDRRRGHRPCSKQSGATSKRQSTMLCYQTLRPSLAGAGGTSAGIHDGLRIEGIAMNLWPALCFSVALLPNAVLAQDYVLKSLKIDRPFARATPPGAETGGVFFTVENRGEIGDRLIRASSPIAGTVELHQMTVEAGVMKMRAIQAVEVKPAGKLELKPGGYHLMLFDLRQPLKKGDKFPLTLTFARAGALEVSVVVEDMTLPIGATPKP